MYMSQKPLFKTLNLNSFIGVQAHTAHVHLIAQNAQAYSAIEVTLKWLDEVENGMYLVSGTNGTVF